MTDHTNETSEGFRPRAAGVNSGEALMNVAIALMRETKSEMTQINKKLDDIATERREEARANGAMQSSIAHIEDKLKEMPSRSELQAVKEIQDKLVTKAELDPIRRLVYGTVALIGIYILGRFTKIIP